MGSGQISYVPATSPIKNLSKKFSRLLRSLNLSAKRISVLESRLLTTVLLVHLVGMPS